MLTFFIFECHYVLGNYMMLSEYFKKLTDLFTQSWGLQGVTPLSRWQTFIFIWRWTWNCQVFNSKMTPTFEMLAEIQYRSLVWQHIDLIHSRAIFNRNESEAVGDRSLQWVVQLLYLFFSECIGAFYSGCHWKHGKSIPHTLAFILNALRSVYIHNIQFTHF